MRTLSLEGELSAGGRAAPIREMLDEVGRDRTARMALVASALALAAAGLDPKVYGPTTQSVQQALREQPSLQATLLAASVVGAAFYLLGGALGDMTGRRRILLVGLFALFVGDLGGLFFDGTPLFNVSRIVASAGIGLVVPIAIASVAMAYSGPARATAIGIAYAVYGLAGAASSGLLNEVESTPIGRWPAFLVGALGAAFALWAVQRWLVVDRPPADITRADVVGHALWAFALTSITAGVVGIGGGVEQPLRWALIGLGLGVLVVFRFWERRRPRRTSEAATIDVRPVTIALLVGVIIAIAQAAPLIQIPLFLQIVDGYGPLAASIAIAPFVIALVVAGPVAGYLLPRVGPRTLVSGGIAAVGLGDLLVGLLAAPGAGYGVFFLSFVLIGAGFVLATTVRTAIVFASVPRGLPATAAAVNETSIAIGSRIGVITVTAIVAQVAVATFAASLGGMSAADAAKATADFQQVVVTVGSNAFHGQLAGIDPATLTSYGVAYATGVATAMRIIGLVALGGAVVAWFGLGRRDPLTSVWEHRDERGAASGGPDVNPDLRPDPAPPA
jgi:MFS family permease